MQTFERVIFDVYLPAYTDLYSLKKNTSNKDLQNQLYFIAQNIKMHDHYAGNCAVIEKCNNILKRVSNKQERRSTLDLYLFELMYTIRIELKAFCVMFYPLSGSHDLRLEKHYTWNIK